MIYINCALSQTDINYLQSIAKNFGIPIIYEKPKHKFYLAWEKQKIVLKMENYVNPLFVDFQNNQLIQRSIHARNELIVKAINLKKYKNIWDVTAGLGKDAFILASVGANITLFEQNPLIGVLLWDGIIRAKQNNLLYSIIERIHFIFGSIFDPNLLPKNKPDVIYLDPMFPERKKSALVKKEMIFLQNITGKHDDPTKLFEVAQQLARFKIVVKRSKLAPNINHISPTQSIRGKSIRFDIYTNH